MAVFKRQKKEKKKKKQKPTKDGKSKHLSWLQED